MRKQLLMAALCALLSLFYAGTSAAAPTVVFVPAAKISDMVYDFRRDLIYIANGNEVLRYSPTSGQQLAAIPLDMTSWTRSIDISRDGTLLAVADQTYTADAAWVYLIDLRTGVATKHVIPRADPYSDSGTWSVAFAADDTLLVTTDYAGSGWVTMRRLNLATDTWTPIGTSIRMQTMLAASTDRQTIAFAEANVSDGPWGLYDVPTRQFVRRSGYTDGTATFNFDVTTDAMGGTFAIPSYSGIFIYDANFQKKWTLTPGGGGAAFHPVQPLLYYPKAGTSQMRVFNTATGKAVAWYDMGEVFPSVGYFAFQAPGRTKLSADGSLLMMVGTGGLRYARLYAPLAAHNVATTAKTGLAKAIALPGSIGNGGTLSYQRWSLPKHGTVTVSGNTATYKSAAGYKGSDSFRYLVRYGAAAFVVATVTVTVQ